MGAVMKIRFEEWLKEQEIVNDANDLFNESIICYKASAYRAALLFSFLGFQTIIKHRIINSKAAKDYSEGEWNQLIRNLSNDDKWDKIIIETVQNKKKAVFNLSEDIREQYLYWKNRRNDCAHAKGNTISYPHVESFWLFIQSNLAKFVVNGGMKYILQKIRNHFDPTRTPSGTPIMPIIKQVTNAIEPVEFNQLLIELMEFTMSKYNKIVYLNLNEYLADMWLNMFELPEEYSEILVDYLVKEFEFGLLIIRSKPQIVRYFYNKATFIRLLWKKDLVREEDYRIFIELLRHNLIPETQLNEAFEHVFNKLPTGIFDENTWWLELEQWVNEVDKQILIEKGFFEKFNEQAFEDEKIAYNFNWGNRNTELVIYYIKQFGLNETIVTALNRALTVTHPPFKLRDELVSYYKQNQEELEFHIELSEKLSTTIPKVLNGLLVKEVE